MQKPNFFIVGAPKCGTTSLAHWLSQHPQVFFCPHKEPHHFNTDEVGTYVSREAYESLFEQASHRHLAIGEASTWYLHSDAAIPNIEQYNPSARYIVCLRNPIEMAPSLHEQKVFMGYEHVKDFATAWGLRHERSQGRGTLPLCRNPVHLDYGTACKIGAQLKRLFERVDRPRVLTILMDDLKRAPQTEYQRVLDFLGLNHDGRTDFTAENPAKVRRFPLVNTIMQYLVAAKEKLGIKKSLGLLGPLEKRNIIFRAREGISPEISAELEKFFADDIQLLSELLQRDLSSWLTPKTPQS